MYNLAYFISSAFSNNAVNDVLQTVFGVNGDSRTAQAAFTERSGGASLTPVDTLINARDTKNNGWIGHFLYSIKHRIHMPLGGQYAIGGANTSNIAARINTDVNTAVSVGIKTVFFLAGVNDGGLTVAQTISNYQTIFSAYTNAGIRLVVLNELPSNSLEGNPTNHLARVAWLSDPQREIDYPGLIRVDTFNACLKPGTQATWKDGYSYDGLHPTYIGSREIGFAVAQKLLSYVSTKPPLYVLPTTQNTQLFHSGATGLMTGTGGTKLGSPLPLGDVATGWSLAPTSADNAGLTIEASKTISTTGFDEQTIRIFGTSNATSLRGFNFLSTSFPSAVARPAGTKFRAVAKLKVEAGNIGYNGIGIGLQFTGTGVTGATSYGMFYTVTINSDAAEQQGEPLDIEVMSQDLVLPSEWDAATNRSVMLRINCGVQGWGRPVDATIRLSQVGLFEVT